MSWWTALGWTAVAVTGTLLIVWGLAVIIMTLAIWDNQRDQDDE